MLTRSTNSSYSTNSCGPRKKLSIFTPQFNIEPENGRFQRDSKLGNQHFQVPVLTFWGVELLGCPRIFFGKWLKKWVISCNLLINGIYWGNNSFPNH